MSIDSGDINESARLGARRLLARGAGDGARAAARLNAAIADLHLPDSDRSDDRLRATVQRMIAQQCAVIERDLRQYAARLLVSRGVPELALALTGDPPLVHEVLAASRTLRDPALLAMWFARANEALLAERLPIDVNLEQSSPPLILRLTEDADGVVARAAAAFQAAYAHRRAALSTNEPADELPAERQHQLVWAAAAVLRRAYAPAAGAELGALDAALAEAAARALAAHDESQGLEAAAMQLAAALAPAPDDRAALLAQALGEGQLALFIAVLANVLGTSYAVMREITIDPAGEQLWLALRAAALDRSTIARVGLALAEADARRDVELFADQIDAIMAVAPGEARLALADCCLQPDLRAATLAITAGVPER